MIGKICRDRALAAVLLFTAATAGAQVPNNSITFTWSPLGTSKGGTVTVREGSPRGQIVYTETFSSPANFLRGLDYPVEVVMAVNNGGQRAAVDEVPAVKGGVATQTFARIVLDPRFLVPGTSSAVNLRSSAHAAFPFQPGFDASGIPADLCGLGNLETTSTIAISGIQIEKLEQRFHVMKLDATIDGRCTANGRTFRTVMKADEPSLGGVLVSPPAVVDTPAPPPPISELPRTKATYSLALTSDKTANIGGIGGGKTYSLSQKDAREIITFARAGAMKPVGSPPAFFSIRLNTTAAVLERTGILSMVLAMGTFGEFVAGKTYAGGDEHAVEAGLQETQFELEMNLLFCSGGVISNYTVEDFTWDCESLASPANDGTVLVIPHLRSLKVAFTTRCGSQKGGFKGTLSFNDPLPGNEDCANPITGAPPKGITGGGTPTTPTPGNPTPGTPTPTDPTPGTPAPTDPTPTVPTPNPTPTNAPGITIPEDIRSNGLVMASGQSASINISTVTPASVAGEVSLTAVSNPPGLDVSISPSHFASPGNGGSVVTITAGPASQAQDYTVTIAATGTNGTSFTSFTVSVLCDPPMILGLNQPKSITINRGFTTSFDVAVNGSAPFNYQWYAGESGNTASPIAGANGRTFTTPALNSGATYWVRVSNTCGSADSNSARVTIR